MNRGATLIKHSIVYLFGVFIVNTASFFLIPIYARNLQPSEYGILEIINICIDISVIIFSGGLGMACLSLYCKEDEENRKNLAISSGMTLAYSLAASGSVIFFFLSRSLCDLLFQSDANLMLFRMAGFLMASQLCCAIPMAYIQARMDSRFFILISSLQSTLIICTNIVTVVILDMKVAGIIGSNLIVTSTFALFLAASTLKRTGWRCNLGVVKRLLAFGLPFVPAALFLFVMNTADRFFIQRLLDSSVVGTYALGYKIGLLPSLIILGPFLRIWGPFMFGLDKESEGKDSFGKYLLYLVSLYCILGLVIALFAREIIGILASQGYQEGYRVVPYILVAYVFSAAAYFFDSGFYITEKTIYKPFLMGASACLIFLLYWHLIPVYGMLGGAYATVVCYVVFASMTFLASYHVYPVKYPLGKMLYVLTVGVLVYVLSLHVPDSSVPLYMAGKFGLILVYVFAILLSGIPERADLQSAKSYVQSLIKKDATESVGLS